MTYTGFQRIFTIYRDILEKEGVHPVEIDPNLHLTRSELLGHCRWMLETVVEPSLHRVGGWEESMRLLGCIQGALVAVGVCTIAEARAHIRIARLGDGTHPDR